jgi:hypothetical protein
MVITFLLERNPIPRKRLNRDTTGSVGDRPAKARVLSESIRAWPSTDLLADPICNHGLRWSAYP